MYSLSSKIRASSRSLAGFSNNWAKGKTKKVLRLNNKSFSSSSPGPNWRNNGTPEIVIGTTILSLLLVDQLLQMYNMDENSVSKKAVIYELERAIENDQLALKRSTNNNANDVSITSHPLVGLDGKELASLYKCQIMKIPKYFDGTRSLKNVEVDDVVQILKEFVGPDSNYHLCRIEKKMKDKTQTGVNDGNEDQHDSLFRKLDATYHYGWFPVTCLKKM